MSTSDPAGDQKVALSYCSGAVSDAMFPPFSCTVEVRQRDALLQARQKCRDILFVI